MTKMKQPTKSLDKSVEKEKTGKPSESSGLRKVECCQNCGANEFWCDETTGWSGRIEDGEMLLQNHTNDILRLFCSKCNADFDSDAIEMNFC